MFSAYNVAHALFSSTVPIIQTALATSPLPPARGDGQRIEVLFDRRLMPAYYLMLVATVSFLALTIGVAVVRKHRQRVNEKAQMLRQLRQTLSHHTEDEVFLGTEKARRDEDRRFLQSAQAISEDELNEVRNRAELMTGRERAFSLAHASVGLHLFRQLQQQEEQEQQEEQISSQSSLT